MTKDILTLEEVAEYLRISERTVYDWAQKGEIPAGKLGTSWRFKKGDIEKWVDTKLSAKNPFADDHQLDMKKILPPERVTFLKEKTKAEALKKLIALLAEAPQVQNKEALREAIFAREELMSTGIGMGIAVPHVRIPSVKDLVLAIGISRNGIEDYQSLDNRPVEIMIMVAARDDQHAYYLKALASISGKLKNPVMKEKLLHAKTEEGVYRLMTGTEIQ